MNRLTKKILSLRICSLAFLLLVIAVPALTLNEVAKLLASDGASSDVFGVSAAVSGNTVLIGATGDSDFGVRSGSAYVFDLGTATGTLNEIAKLLPSDGGPVDQCGFTVAVSGTTAVVGAPDDDDNGTDSGSAYVFDLTGATGVVNEIAKMVASDGMDLDELSHSLALSGTTVLAGARGDDDLGLNSGSVYVFDVTSASGTLNEVAKLRASDGAADDSFGFSVDIDGDVAVIGAFGDDDNGSVSGSAYMFVRASGVWSQQAKLLPSDGATLDSFGVAVALSGTTAVVGAWLDDDLGINSGSAYVFDLSSASGTVTEIAKLLPSDGAAADGFGRKVAVDGTTAIVGAIGDDDNGTSSGSAYVFDLVGASGTLNEVEKLLPSDGAAGDIFGVSVAVGGGKALVGAINDDDSGIDSGSAYVFALVSDDEGPITSNSVATPNPVAVNTAVTLTANADDTSTGNSNIAAADYKIDDGTPVSMAAQDGDFDEVSEDVIAAISAFAQADVHQLCVSGTDAAGNQGEEDCTLLAVYDPTTGFVTGGGWIDSPAGSCQLTPGCMSQTGKANFGFVSKYQQGTQTPTGNTKFLFKAGDLKFDSDSYEWLVVANHKAQYKGVGTINGGGNYGFKLFAIDADLTSSTEIDLFRIKIWDKDNGDFVVYDNESGNSESADPTTEIGGGSIVIHVAGTE